MPAKVAKRGNKYRVVEPSGRLVRRTRRGKPIDGHGHRTKKRAQRQARAVNTR